MKKLNQQTRLVIVGMLGFLIGLVVVLCLGPAVSRFLLEREGLKIHHGDVVGRVCFKFTGLRGALFSWGGVWIELKSAHSEYSGWLIPNSLDMPEDVEFKLEEYKGALKLTLLRENSDNEIFTQWLINTSRGKLTLQEVTHEGVFMDEGAPRSSP